MEDGKIGCCKKCEHKEFYERYKELDEYVEKEADKRIAKMIESGKVVKGCGLERAL